MGFLQKKGRCGLSPPCAEARRPSVKTLSFERRGERGSRTPAALGGVKTRVRYAGCFSARNTDSAAPAIEGGEKEIDGLAAKRKRGDPARENRDTRAPRIYREKPAKTGLPVKKKVLCPYGNDSGGERGRRKEKGGGLLRRGRPSHLFQGALFKIEGIADETLDDERRGQGERVGFLLRGCGRVRRGVE